jgi:hypothetical protein
MYFNLNNKRGFADIVAMVFVILISISSIFLLIGIVGNISKEQLSPALECNSYQALPPVKILQSCISNEGEVQVTLNRNFETIKISKLNFALNSGTESTKYECGLSCGENCIILNPGETKKYYFTLPSSTSPDKLIISIDNCFIGEKEIAQSCLEL